MMREREILRKECVHVCMKDTHMRKRRACWSLLLNHMTRLSNSQDTSKSNSAQLGEMPKPVIAQVVEKGRRIALFLSDFWRCRSDKSSNQADSPAERGG